jgi:hypothetical protein
MKYWRVVVTAYLVAITFIASFAFPHFSAFGFPKTRPEIGPEWDVIVCGHARMEATNLREWVLWNSVAGVQHFVIYDNNDAAPGGLHDAFDDALAPFPPSLVTTRRYPKDVMNDLALAEAYGFDQNDFKSLNMTINNPLKQRCYEDYKHRARWIAFIDTDEVFVPLHENLTLPVLLSHPRFANDDSVGGVGFFWRMTSYSGHFAAAGRSFSDYRTCPRASGANRVLKTVAKATVYGRPTVRQVNHAHFLDYNEGFHCIPETAALPGGDERGCSHSDLFGNEWTTFDGSAFMQLNHYFSRSVENWLRKVLRGLYFQTSVDGLRSGVDFTMNSACFAVDDAATARSADRVAALRAELNIPPGPPLGPLPPFPFEARAVQPVIALFYDALANKTAWDESFYLLANANRPECLPTPPFDALMHFWTGGGYSAGCKYQFS